MDRAVFIDRDGTIGRDVPYCSRPEDMEILPGVAEGLKLLNERGFKVVVITNQSGIARGYFTAEMLAKIHERLIADLTRSGAHVDAIYYCPHHPDEGCECRKPHPGLLFRAASDLALDLSRSYMIGNTETDMETGRRAGCGGSFLVSRGAGEAHPGRLEGVLAFDSVLEAARWVIHQADKKHRGTRDRI